MSPIDPLGLTVDELLVVLSERMRDWQKQLSEIHHICHISSRVAREIERVRLMLEAQQKQTT